jgi:FAD/FMN-containing dehydrogenase
MNAPPPTARLSWGRVPHPPPRHVVEPLSRSWSLELRPDLTYLPYGNGRSYGDSCLNPTLGVISTRRLDRFIAWDAQNGILTCEGGALFADIIRFAMPQGWFLPVTPGTKFVTVGGAIANDVHGKNHHVAGTFGQHVDAIQLLRSDGNRSETARNSGADRFTATIGGLGLTGLIAEATLRLKPVHGPWLEQQIVRFRSLEQFFEIDAKLRPRHEYTVAWVDCTATGDSSGRGLYMAANHIDLAGASRGGRSRLRIPLDPPVSLVGALSLRAFNWLYYHRPRPRDRHRIHYEQIFYPLDSVLEWNRIYGPRGFFQFQCVVPPAASRSALGDLLILIARHRAGSFLAVLKTFGDQRSEGFLSFPRPGTTLALDFPDLGETTRRLFSEMEAVVIQHGGALYPAKDGLMSSTAFKAGFPAWEQMREHIDPRFSSQFARRVGLLA